MQSLKRLFSYFTLFLDFLLKYFKLLILALIVLFLFQSQSPSIQSQANLAKLYLRGPIFESESFEREIEEIKKSPNIKGVLLIINSPGGGVGASIEIADMIKELRDSLPVIVYVEGAMASGSYYAGMYGDKIIANRGALIGSIGVIFNSFNLQPLLLKLGIQEQSLQEGEYKSIGTLMREWTPKEKAYLQSFLKQQYTLFIQDVLQARNLSNTDPHVFADGKIFTSAQALKLGLIDQIGSRADAVRALVEITQIQEPIFLEKSKTEQMIEKLSKISLSTFFTFLQGTLQ